MATRKKAAAMQVCTYKYGEKMSMLKEIYIPRSSNRCFLEAFKHLKTTRKHLFEGAGL